MRITLPRLDFERLLLHLGLGLWTSPLPGLLLVATRAGRQGRIRRSLPGLTLAAGFLVASLGVALLLPWSWTAAGSLTALLFLSGGVCNRWAEALGEVEPPRPEGTAAGWGNIPLWILAAVLGWSGVAFVVATWSTRWGPLVFAKPFFARLVTEVLLVTLVPVGLGVGAFLAALRRPSRPAALVTAALASGVLAGLFLLVAVPYAWIWLSLLEVPLVYLQRFDTLPTPAAWTVGVLMVLLPGLSAWAYLSLAGGVRSFLRRCMVIAGLLLSFAMADNLLRSDRALDVRERLAEQAAGRGDAGASLAHRKWILARASRSQSEMGRNLRDLLRDAVLTRDGAEVRAALEAVRRRMPEGGSRPRAAALVAALEGAEPGELEAVRVAVTPVRLESYLTPSWTALLTAVRAVRPAAAETPLKLQLLELSSSPDEVELDELVTLRDLRARARFFDCDLVAVPLGARDEVLRRGLPLLFPAPGGRDWQVLFGAFPSLGAVLTLDYDRWHEDEQLERAQVEQLVAGNQEVERHADRILGRLRRLDSAAWLEERLRGSVGRLFAVVPAEGRAALLADLGGTTDELEMLARLDDARLAYEKGAPRRALELLSELPPGPRVDELLALLRLDPARRAELDEYLTPELAERAERAGHRLRSPAGISAASDRALMAVWDRASRSPDGACELRRPLAEALWERDLRGAAAGWLLLEIAVREADPAKAARWASELDARFGGAEVLALRLLETLAGLPGAGEVPELRELMEDLLARLGSVVQVAGRDDRFSWVLAEIQGARAALASSAAERRAGWARAVEIEPRNPAYLIRLAEAEAALGNADAARRARHLAQILRPREPCPPLVLSTATVRDPALADPVVQGVGSTKAASEDTPGGGNG